MALLIEDYALLGDTQTAALVGRDEELGDFRALAEACVQRRRSRVVIVRGDPGVGKSRLVAEFVASARALGFSCHGAPVLDFGAETGRDAVRSLARSLLGVDGAADEATRRTAIERASQARPMAPEQLLFLHDLLDVSRELNLMLARLPGMGRVKRRVDEQQELKEGHRPPT